MIDEGVLGIVAEYNPFHNGHLYHLRKSKEITGANAVIAAMSGNFTQRGEPAIIDKWKRAEIAVMNGVDLVIELPFLYACNSAEYFAEGAVKLLTALEIVDFISFGAEDGNIHNLERIAEILAHEPAEFRCCLKKHTDSGLSFPAARQKALVDVIGDERARILKYPNNILAIEYLKQIRRTGSGLKPTVVHRTGAGHEELDPDSGTAGASAIRKLLFSGQTEEAFRYMPKSDFDNNFARLDHYYTLAVYAARTKSIGELNEIQSASEGLEYKLKKALDSAHDLKSLISALKSKRYTQTRIQRFIMQAVFGITKNIYLSLNTADNVYVRVLGMNQTGRNLLNRIKHKSKLAIVTKLKKQKPEVTGESKLLDLDILAADIYNLVSERDSKAESDYRKKPFIMS